MIRKVLKLIQICTKMTIALNLQTKFSMEMNRNWMETLNRHTPVVTNRFLETEERTPHRQITKTIGRLS